MPAGAPGPTTIVGLNTRRSPVTMVIPWSADSMNCTPLYWERSEKISRTRCFLDRGDQVQRVSVLDLAVDGLEVVIIGGNLAVGTDVPGGGQRVALGRHVGRSNGQVAVARSVPAAGPLRVVVHGRNLTGDHPRLPRRTVGCVGQCSQIGGIIERRTDVGKPIVGHVGPLLGGDRLVLVPDLQAEGAGGLLRRVGH